VTETEGAAKKKGKGSVSVQCFLGKSSKNTIIMGHRLGLTGEGLSFQMVHRKKGRRVDVCAGLIGKRHKH